MKCLLSRGNVEFLSLLIPGAIFMLLALSVSKQAHFTASCPPWDGTYFITDALCRVGFPPGSVLRLVCVKEMAVPSYSLSHPPTAICLPLWHLSTQCSASSSVSHWYSLTKEGELKECCWANGMTGLVIWKLPALCVFHYWQWCSRRIYGSSKTLVNFSLLFRCHLYTNEVIERALYAVAGTLLT